MTEKMQIFKCEVCGNMVEMIHSGAGQLVCCGAQMTLYEENTVDAAREKHVPVIEKGDNSIKITVGSVLHPMEESHYIEWIELIADGCAYRKFLNPGDTPEATFCVSANQITAREYCNLHGLWKS